MGRVTRLVCNVLVSAAVEQRCTAAHYISYPQQASDTTRHIFTLAEGWPVWVQTPDSQPTKVETFPQIRTVPHKH